MDVGETLFGEAKSGLGEEVKDFEKATEIYQTIIDEYPAFANQNTVEKYKARASNSTAK